MAHGRALAAVYPAMMRSRAAKRRNLNSPRARFLDPSLRPLNDGGPARRWEKRSTAFSRSSICGPALKTWVSPKAMSVGRRKRRSSFRYKKNHPRVASADEVFDLLNKSYRNEPEKIEK